MAKPEEYRHQIAMWVRGVVAMEKLSDEDREFVDTLNNAVKMAGGAFRTPEEIAVALVLFDKIRAISGRVDKLEEGVNAAFGLLEELNVAKAEE